MPRVPKYVNFFERLNLVVSSLDRNQVKTFIGDSVNNNRTLTIGQVVRFLTNSKAKDFTNLGKSLSSLNNLLGSSIKNTRNNYRTDALDINEFLNFYQTSVINDGEFRTLISRNI